MMQPKRKHIVMLFPAGVAIALAAMALLWGKPFTETEKTADIRSASVIPAAKAAGTAETAMDRRFGIKPVAVFATAGGFFLDFRYVVTDTAKAKGIINTRTQPVLTDIDSGARFRVPTTPKVGALRQTRMPPDRKGRMHFMLFGNPGSKVKPGQKVKISIGEYETGALVVN